MKGMRGVLSGDLEKGKIGNRAEAKKDVHHGET